MYIMNKIGVGVCVWVGWMCWGVYLGESVNETIKVMGMAEIKGEIMYVCVKDICKGARNSRSSRSKDSPSRNSRSLLKMQRRVTKLTSR